MKQVLSVFRFYLLNSIYAYAWFALYSITVAPNIIESLEFGEKNYLVGIIGLLILPAEYFALKFKLWIIRVRAEKSLIELEKENSEVLIINPSYALIYGLFVRIILRISVLFFSLIAIGQDSMVTGMLIIVMFFADMIGLMYIYITSNIFQDQVPEHKIPIAVAERQEWRDNNIPGSDSLRNFIYEILADIALNVYAYVVFTLVWYYINWRAIDSLKHFIAEKSGAFETGYKIAFMLTFMVLVLLIPIRVAYWIEDSMNATTRKHKYAFSIMVILSGIYACMPTLVIYCSHFFCISNSTSEFLKSRNFNWLLAVILVVIVALIQTIMTLTKSKKLNEIIIQKTWD
ncbi:MAG: hypothetical protein ABI772_06380 [Bacteroidota bacterium]